MIFRSANPALSRVQRMYCETDSVGTAKYSGIALKSIYFIVLTFIAAVGSFIGSVFLIEQGNIGLLIGLLIGSSIVSIVCAFVAILNPYATKIAGSIYAVAQGFVMGFTALMFWSLGFSGEVFSALFATIGVFGIMMILYATGIIRIGSGFRKFMISALIAAIVVNLLMFIISLFSASLSNLFYGNGWFSIGISIIMVVLASLMILLDLDRMTQIVQGGLDKKYEWIAAFGLLITLVWLYMEFLRLFSKLASRRR
ncbi:MAG: Bax inhibitor-1/YccA family protein [Firmicutes bacterium]|nr:Bax inhibitor-1/YccA family protein [Bacillota bacterium]